VTAAIAAFEMTTESGGATHLDGGHDASLRLLTIGFAVAAKDVRHFQLRALHGPGDQKGWGCVDFTSIETGRGSKSRGLEVEHTLLVARRRYFAVVARLRCPSRVESCGSIGTEI
jgi:hypothetical protein